jgi:hypothetical protein
MSAATELTPPPPAPTASEALRPRAQVMIDAWLALDRDVAALSNGSGRPLARTVKLILEPLVIRPVQNPGLAGGALSADAAAQLHARILAAGPDLAATAAWFLRVKTVRRRLRVTEGNPQEKYFSRCFELARTIGMPGADAEDRAVEVVTEIAQASGDSLLGRIRELLRDAHEVARLEALLHEKWAQRTPPRALAPASEVIAAMLDTCPTGHADAAFEALRISDAGSSAASTLGDEGTARLLGLTAHASPPVPLIGSTASKRGLPRPFDRSIFERLFAALSAGATVESDLDGDELLAEEIDRSALPWELADEHSRIMMLLGREVSRALDASGPAATTAAHRQLASRWNREAYVRRALRLPAEVSGVPASVLDDIHDVRQAYLRRLWVRMHGRELRGQVLGADDVWDTLDGVLRSVVMDQRQRLKIAMGRGMPAPSLPGVA